MVEKVDEVEIIIKEAVDLEFDLNKQIAYK